MMGTPGDCTVHPDENVRQELMEVCPFTVLSFLFLTVFESLEMLRRPTMPSFNEF